MPLPRYLFDTDALNWLFAQDVDPDASSSRQTWLAELHASRRHLLIPASTLADCLLESGTPGDARFKALRACCTVEVLAFDERAARELVRLARTRRDMSDDCLDELTAGQRQIIALARLREATVVGADPALELAAGRLGLPFRHCASLSGPAARLPQLSLPLDPVPEVAVPPSLPPADVFLDMSRALDAFMDAVRRPHPDD